VDHGGALLDRDIGVATLKSPIGLRQHDRGHAEFAFLAI